MTVTVGNISDTPAPGDPIRSEWAQDVTNIGRHIFASKAALDAATAGWTGLVDGAFAFTLSEQLVWNRISSAWVAFGSHRLLGRKIDSTNVSVPTGGANIVAAVTFTLPAARLIRIHGSANFTASAGIGALLNCSVNASVITPRIGQINELGPGAVLSGDVLTLAAAGSVSVILAAAGIGGTASTAGTTDPSVCEVYDEGPGPLPT